MSMQVDNIKIKGVVAITLVLIVITTVVGVAPLAHPASAIPVTLEKAQSLPVEQAALPEEKPPTYENYTASTNSLYSPIMRVESILSRDFSDYADYDSKTTGYGASMYVNLTNLGTIEQIYYNYTSGKGLPVMEKDSMLTVEGRTGGVGNKPLEGWYLAYGIRSTPPLSPSDPYDDIGFLFVTYSVVKNSTTVDLAPTTIAKGNDDNWTLGVVKKVLIDNPRLYAVFYNITATNEASPFKPSFLVQIVAVYPKYSKHVMIWQRAQLVNVTSGRCTTLNMDVYFGRMAQFDANAYCDRAFYAARYINLTKISGNIYHNKKAFMVLSWTNETLRKWTGAKQGFSYYADYMLVFPAENTTVNGVKVNFTYALASTHYSITSLVAPLSNSPEAQKLYLQWRINNTIYSNKVYLNQDQDIDGDNEADGDQALVRVEWYLHIPGKEVSELRKYAIVPWRLIVYGVYNVNGTYKGEKALDYIEELDDALISGEATLSKSISNTSVIWSPSEELRKELEEIFHPTTFGEISDVDRIVIPAPGATTDAAAAAYAALVWRPTGTPAIMFDVAVKGLKATIGYTNPYAKYGPSVMYALMPTDIKNKQPYREGSWKSGRIAAYVTSDLRSFIESDYIGKTLVSIAGIRPNLLTFYANDFLSVVKPINGSGNLIKLALLNESALENTIAMFDNIMEINNYTGNKTKGLGIIAIARDYVGTGTKVIVVYGLDAQDTYWTGYYLYNQWSSIASDYKNATAIIVEIDYSSSPVPSFQVIGVLNNLEYFTP